MLRLRCQHLALFGTADQLVPVTDSVALFTEAACRPGRPDRCSLTVGVFPGADHRVRMAGSICFASGYFTTLTQWIGARSTTDRPD